MEQLQILMSKRSNGSFWNTYPYHNSLNNLQYYHRFPNYLMGPDSANSFYSQDSFINNPISCNPVIPTNTFPFIKPEEFLMSKPFPIDGFGFNRNFNYPSNISQPSAASRESDNAINYSTVMGSTTCRYPVQSALSTNMSTNLTNFPLPNFKY